MLKKISFILVASFFVSQTGLAATRGTDVLAACTKTTDKAQGFQVKGESSVFTGLRMGPAVSEVSLVDVSGDVFPGNVTLTKGAPYQFVLYGLYVGKAAPGDLYNPTTVIYGTSAGSKMFVTETIAGKAVNTYECDVNMNLIATP